MDKWETTVEWESTIFHKLSEKHDKILLKEIVASCNEYEILDYEIDVDMLKEALDLYIKAKEKLGKDINVPTKKTNFEKLIENDRDNLIKKIAENFCINTDKHKINSVRNHYCGDCDYGRNGKSCQLELKEWLESEVEE